jgi:hypothetical protein
MQPTTTGMAAILAQVRMLGRDSELLATPLVVAMFIRPSNTAEASRRVANAGTKGTLANICF